MYCNASSTALPAVCCFQFKKRYWFCNLPCIRAQIELLSTFVYDYKMSTGGSSVNDTDAHACDLFVYPKLKKQNIIIKKKILPSHNLNKGVTKIFRVVNLLPPQGFRPEAKFRGGTLVTRAHIKDSTYSSNIQSVY